MCSTNGTNLPDSLSNYLWYRHTFCWELSTTYLRICPKSCAVKPIETSANCVVQDLPLHISCLLDIRQTAASNTEIKIVVCFMLKLHSLLHQKCIFILLILKYGRIRSLEVWLEWGDKEWTQKPLGNHPLGRVKSPFYIWLI